ncbi:Retrotransposon protein [Seminavis robusta]|uniref:Retrotransposon protein n=1 Tax=Seminavis robusta TaxID=568900 RepID=A0A9N8DZJ1_9STRA|nr:Retrotransposon protein [Seminavis robusta]CAB9509701.1 Retrotransposon protein [Seminavis robusta]|eukprot:Sro183_g079530.1 Retrotransposon protein (129) ;mRNA; r:131-517
MVDTALQTAAYAARATMHHTMKLSPGAMVYGRDMILNIPVEADFQLLRQRREARINYNLMNENKRRIHFDYQVNDQVLRLVPQPNKLDNRAEGPYTITRVHTNGSITIRLSPHIEERVNIRGVKPYRQ